MNYKQYVCWFLQKACYLSVNPQKEETIEAEKSVYTLPDGSSLEVGTEVHFLLSAS